METKCIFDNYIKMRARITKLVHFMNISKRHLQLRERISSDKDPLAAYSLVCLSSEIINAK
jgi:hypothetical protein